MLQYVLDIRRIGQIKEGDVVQGNQTRVKVLKNKVAPPFRQAEFQILYNEGINRVGEILDMAVDQGLLEKSGTWYSFNDERIGQGRRNAEQWLKNNAEVADEIEAKIRDRVFHKEVTEDGTES